MEKEFNRREFMKTAAGAVSALAIASAKSSMVFAEATGTEPKTISMIKLPYADNALEPSISARTVNLHYHNHHHVPAYFG